ncbi:hypothetical protein [Echinicola sp. 20G]|uniref:hypothetical protein n=1 Tax=Echinicola sp. 20G TaxID=2781961 RepID=UPI0019107F06|nr:hypothetical protein [Echinicola sp. 20G]
MENQTKLLKGELMEEKLRTYFLNNGYYVARGVKYSFENNEITDIDLFLYGRFSSLDRVRTNVDIKNKKTPKAFERILWAKGLQELLGFDNCVVATSDKKDVIRKYGLKHKATILDGNFLQKLPEGNNERLSEEDLCKLLASIKSFKEYRNQTWKGLYELSKSRLLNELDFSGYNSTIILLNYFIRKCFDKQKQNVAIRATYVILSHSLIILDFLLKDIAFLEPSKRKEALSDGFKYGNLGKEGVNRTIEMAVRIADSKISVNEIKKALDTTEMDILKEFFSKAETTKKIFSWAKAFEELAFSRQFKKPLELDSEIKSVLAIMLDFYKINRKEYFEI